MKSAPFSAQPLRSVSVSAGDLVREDWMGPEPPILLIEALDADLDLAQWLAAQKETLIQKLTRHGGLLFRGFRVSTPGEFGEAAASLTPDVLDYVERAAARQQVAPGVFTSTGLAADQRIPLHHEMSYSHNWPWHLYFYCDTAPTAGGRTPIASERRFFPRLDKAIRARFERYGLMYVRNFGEGIDLSWQAAFQATNRHEVESYCRASGIEWEWRDGDRLRTRQVRQASARHPLTGETVWFNHAHLFHESNLPPALRETLVSALGSGGLPRNAYYGDGSPIEDAVLDEIRGLYDACAFAFEWRRGDVLLLDNFLMVHGREPFTGSRRILVAMADMCNNGAADEGR